MKPIELFLLWLFIVACMGIACMGLIVICWKIKDYRSTNRRCRGERSRLVRLVRVNGLLK